MYFSGTQRLPMSHPAAVESLNACKPVINPHISYCSFNFGFLLFATESPGVFEAVWQ